MIRNNELEEVLKALARAVASARRESADAGYAEIGDDLEFEIELDLELASPKNDGSSVDLSEPGNESVASTSWKTVRTVLRGRLSAWAQHDDEPRRQQ